MWKHTYYFKILLALFLYLAPVSLVSCSPRQSGEENMRLSEPSKQKQVDSLAQIIRVNEELEISINNFIKQIQEIQDVNKDLSSINSQDINVQLRELKKLIKEYQNAQEKKSIVLSPNVLKKLNETIKEINTITEPFNNGINNDAVKTIKIIQVKLGILKPDNKDYGQLSSNTKDQIRTYLDTNKNLLNESITNLINSDINFNIQNLNGKIEKVYPEVQYIKLLSFIALVTSLITFVLYLQLLRESSSNRGENRTRSENENYPLSTGKNQQNNVVSSKDFSNPATESKRYQQLYTNLQECASALIQLEERLQTLEQNPRGNNISNYQQPDNFRQPHIAETFHPDISRTSEPSDKSLQSVPVSQFYSPAKLKLVTTYNNNPDSLPRVIEVNITKESLENQRLGSNQYAILEHNSGGNYWILKENNYDYLVPKKNVRLNQFNLITLEALFECQNYQASSKQFNLIKPAKLTSIYGDKWQLEEMGILQFY
jgi:uncharacterized protein YukE